MQNKFLLTISLYISLFYLCCTGENYPAGQRVYTVNCENCHMADGSGLPPLYPNIQKSSFINENITALPCMIRNGKKGQIMETVNMPGVNITSIDMANLINYMTDKWNAEGKMNINEIESTLSMCLY